MDQYPESSAQSSGPASPEPHRRGGQVLSSLRSSIALLEQKKLLRSVQELKLELAKELIELQAWDDALRVLRPLWQGMSYRNEGWWDIVEEVGWTLRMVARRTGDRGTVVAVDWELLNSSTYAERERF
jgi:trafficking protein particle complex subunit 11